MAVSKTSGVTCGHCGASTPLPSDLRVPTFRCAYCAGELETAKYAGVGAVRVDEMAAYMNDVLAAGTTEGHVAPKLVHGTAGFRELPCVGCKAPLQVPLDVTITKVTCGSCKRVDPVNRYIDDVLRMQIDMARQVAGNEELKRLIADGVRCRKCNAHNAVPEPVQVQLECTACRGTILLSDFVAADAVDRARLKHNVFAMRDNLMAKQTANQRRTGIIIGCVIAATFAIVLAALALSR